MIFKKKKSPTAAQLKLENKKLTTQYAKQDEYKKLKQQNYRLKHRKSVKFVEGVDKVGRYVGKKIVKKITSPPKRPINNSRSRSPKSSPIKLSDFI